MACQLDDPKAQNSVKCQFEDETEFFDHDGKSWCRFHLPLAAKKDWSEEEHDAFAATVKGIIDDAQANGSSTNFSYAQFYAIDLSDREKQLPGISFTHAKFGYSAQFEGAKFGSYAYFDGAKFGNFAHFYGATFGDVVAFDGATFGDRAQFDGVKFGLVVHFYGATFGDGAQFVGATFGDHTSFEGTTFGDGVDFSSTNPDGAAGWFEAVSFARAIFSGDVSFNGRHFLGATSFAGAQFRRAAPLFGECRLHEDTNFDRTTFPQTVRPEDGRAYRILKRATETTRDRRNQARFFALEKACEQIDPETPLLVRLGLFIYGKTADYGQSIGKPLLWFMATMVTFFVFYLRIVEPRSLAVEDISEAVRFTLRQVARPLDAARSSESEHFARVFLSIVHSILNFGFVSMFIIAVRRRFRMG